VILPTSLSRGTIHFSPSPSRLYPMSLVFRRAVTALSPTHNCRHFASRGAKGWGWYHRAKEDLAQGKDDPIPFPDNLNPNVDRQKVFFELEGLDDEVGETKLIFELCNDIAPKTCENFLRLCTHEGGSGYRGTIFHQILRDEVAVGGDVDGEGGKSSWASSEEVNGDIDSSSGRGYFADENYAIPHSTTGVLSMVPHGVDQNASQFLITLGEECDHLNGRHVAFGRLVEGKKVLEALNTVFAVHGKPLSPVTVKECGAC
jgi:peptidyl-prolyl isomerase F (cyclophilin D)